MTRDWPAESDDIRFPEPETKFEIRLAERAAARARADKVSRKVLFVPLRVTRRGGHSRSKMYAAARISLRAAAAAVVVAGH